MSTITYTPIYALLVALIYFAYTLTIVLMRYRYHVPLGDGGVAALQKVIRAHGNLTEHAPLVLLALLTYELQGGKPWLINVFGAVYIISRILHGWGLWRSRGVSFGRRWGTIAMLITLLGLGIINVKESLM